MTLRDDFEQDITAELWPEVYGADTTRLCDVVVSGQSLTFYKVSTMIAVFFLNQPLVCTYNTDATAADADAN